MGCDLFSAASAAFRAGMRFRPFRTRCRAAALLAAALALAAAPASAGSLKVNPVKLVLDPKGRAMELSVRNTGGAPVAVELSARAWREDEAGAPAYEEAPELAVLPPLFELPPGEARTVRVAYLGGPVDGPERAYHLTVRELRPEGGAGEVALPLRLVLPVFVPPPKPVSAAGLAGMAVEEGKLAVTVENWGNVHLTLEDAVVAGWGEGKRPLFELRPRGWYVLAGSTRVFRLPLPPGCAGARVVALAARAGEAALAGRADAAPEACAPAAGAP